MSDPCSKETNDKVMERIRKEFVATPTVGELEGEIEQLEVELDHEYNLRLKLETECDALKERLAWIETELRTLELRCIRLEVDSNES
jgi:hypothetical protein